MLSLKKSEIRSKKIKFFCKCGKVHKKEILITDGYGFDDVKCEECGKRLILEYDNDTLSIKLAT